MDDETRAAEYCAQRLSRRAWRDQWHATHAGDAAAARALQAGWQPLIDAYKEDELDDPEEGLSEKRRDERDTPLA